MRESAGRIVFFDAVAEMLLQMHPGAIPRTIALRTRGAEVGFQDDCIGVAQAVARLCAASPVEIAVRSFEELGSLEGVHALVVHASGQSTDVILAALPSVGAERPIVVVVGYSENDAPEVLELVYDPESDRGLIEEATRKLFKEVGVDYDPLAPARVIRHGVGRLGADFDLFEKTDLGVWDDTPSRVERLCHDLSRTWSYEGTPVDAESVTLWVEQFRDRGFVREACQLLAFLRREGFVTKRFIDTSLRRLHDELACDEGRKLQLVSVQPPSKSEPMLAYAFRSVATPISLKRALATSEKRPRTLVCIDDVIVSGRSMLDYLFKHDADVGRRLTAALDENTVSVTILASHADERGIANIERDERCCGAVSVKPAIVMDDRKRVFHPRSVVLSDRSHIDAFEAFCREIGEKINPGNPLGWGDAQWCVVLDYSTPNGTLPILWASGAGVQWQPLFVRRRRPARNRS